LWKAIGLVRGRAWDIEHYSLARADALKRLEVETRAGERGLDFSYRPTAEGGAVRMRALGRFDPGNYLKAVVGGWGIDVRDPTNNRNLVEFCLRVPLGEFLSGGMPRGLARRAFTDRLPQAVVAERRKGYQAADWHESFTSHRDGVAQEVERIAACAPAAAVLDIEAMRRLIRDMPENGWTRVNVVRRYRLAMLRGVTAGHFIRKVSGGND
jgi:asparagine synthase (glutamine-hydrolysing)